MKKSKKLNSKTFLVLFLFVVFSFFYHNFPLNTSALESPAINVSPGVINIELTEPNQVVETEILISSNYSSKTTLNLALAGVDDSSGTLVASGPPTTELGESTTLSSDQVTVPANGTISAYLKVTNTDSLQPGGHYAALTLSQTNSDGSQINLQSTISVSIFIIKRGGEKVDLSIKQQILKLSPFSLPSTATIEYLNTGNIHLTPRASLTIRSLDGRKVYRKGISNEGSLNILPGKTLGDTFDIIRVNKLPLKPTKLKYITEYRADGVSNTRYTEIYNWYIPPFFVLFMLFIVVLFVLLIKKLVKKLRKKNKKTKLKNNTSPTPEDNLIQDIKKPVKIDIK